MKIRLAILSFLVSGCVATDVGNPQTDPIETEISLEAYVPEPLPNALILDDGVEITHAWVAVDEMRFRACETEDEDNGEEEEDVRTSEPVVTDLLTGTSFPQGAAISEQATSFCRFDLRVRPFEVDELPRGAPADLAGLSMLVRGTRKDGNPFVLRATFSETIELDGDITLSDDIVNRLVIGFAVNGWVPQGALAPLDGNPILLDEDTTPDLLDDFRDAVKDSAGLFREATTGTPLTDSSQSSLLE